MPWIDFSNEELVRRWSPIDDVIMGGRSKSSIRYSEQGSAVFSGTVSLENNGGFASVRSETFEHDLSAARGIRARFLGDGNTYKVRLRTVAAEDGVYYQAEFDTQAREWATGEIPFEDFRPSFRGRAVPDAPAMDLRRIRSVGLMIAGKQAGPFRLELAWIDVY